jgi:pre-mRNA branch site protein p14
MSRLPKDANRILFVRNLPYETTSEEMYELFGKYGGIRQIRKGDAQQTRGTAFVVFDDIQDAVMARSKLSGFNVGGRYLIVLFYHPQRFQKKDKMDGGAVVAVDTRNTAVKMEA